MLCGDAFARSNTEREQQAQAAPMSAATASSSLSPVIASAISYRKQKLLLLRFMRSLLRIMRDDDNVLGHMREIRCVLKEIRFIIMLRFIDAALKWLQEIFIPAVHHWYSRMYGIEGTLISFVKLSSTEEVQLFSVVVIGLGKRRTSMWSAARIDASEHRR